MAKKLYITTHTGQTEACKVFISVLRASQLLYRSSPLTTEREYRPDLKKEIFPQLEVLNSLIDAFYNSDLEDPVYGLDP